MTEANDGQDPNFAGKAVAPPPKPDMTEPEFSPKEWRRIAVFLWMQLDGIDTLDDACRDDDAAFRRLARARQQRRFEVSTSDGYGIAFKAAPPIANAIMKGPGE